MPTRLLKSVMFSLMTLSATTHAAEPSGNHALVDRGRMLTVIGGCNDCHTPGYPEAAGKIPEQERLTGNTVGFQGPWGTSYPVNLRLYVQGLSEKDWLARVRQPMRPPMPWFNLRDTNDRDLIAMYLYLRALGPAGKPAPAATAPGITVSTPYFEFVPKNLPKQAQASH